MTDPQSLASNSDVLPDGIPTGTVTFLFTDIEGSTRFWQEFPEQMAVNLSRHDDLLRQSIESNGGYVFKTVGDQFCAAFAHAPDALGAAMATQRALANEPWIGPQITVRIGIHSGSSAERNGDYFGPTVNRVARLMSIGHGGQTLISTTALQLIGDLLPDEVAVRDLGNHRLKDLQRPEHIFQVDIPGLVDEFPPLNSLALIVNNLPIQVTEFIGRENEIEETRRILERERLLTIVGPGGIGKSRLSLELAANVADQFENGVFFVPLAPVASADLAAEAIAESIGFSFASAAPPEEQLLNYLANKKVLLVLDNMEHIIEAAGLVAQILRASPTIKIVVTSRAKLQLSGESTFLLYGLGSDNSWDSLIAARDDEAVQLFMDSARRVRPDFELNEDDLAALSNILGRIQGSPLGIVLAASWLDVLPLKEIAVEIDSSFDFLETELRDLPERQRSARAVFDYSWRLLSKKERQRFAILSIFRGGFTRAAAQDMAGASLRELANLTSKSFITLESDSDRYAVHELLRQYGEASLKTHQGQYQAVRDEHAHFFASLVDAQKETIYRGDHSKILADLDNIRTAWRWAVERRLLEDIRAMLWPLGWFYNLRAFHAESLAMLRLVIDALRMPEPEGLQGIVYGGALANYALELSKLEGADRAAPMVHEGLDIMRRLGAKEDLAWPQLMAGWAFQGPQEIEEAFRESLAIFEDRKNHYGIVYSYMFLGWNYRGQGRHEEALANIQRSLDTSRSLGDLEGQAAAQRQLGLLNLHLGHFEAGCDCFRQERDLWRELGLPRPAGEAIKNLGYGYLLGGDTSRAEEAFLESLDTFEQVADRVNPYWSFLGLARVALRRKQLQTARGFLDKAGDILQGRQDAYDQAEWWRLSGRLSLLRGDLPSAKQALDRALEYSGKANSLELARTIVEVAYLYREQADPEQAARLLGFVRSQDGLPADLIQWRVEPLLELLATGITEQEVSSLLAEGARLEQQEVVDSLG